VPYLIATTDGLLRVDDQGRINRLAEGAFVHAIPGEDDGEAVALDATGQLWDVDEDGAAPFAVFDEGEARCVLANGDDVLVGSHPAALHRREGEGWARLDGFDRAPGRDRWTTPRGGAAAVRTIDVDDDDTLWVNVHVGGILRSTDGGATWTPTIDQDVDVHQVFAVPGRAGTIVAACGAGGLAMSSDRGLSWSMSKAGLSSTYCRAVAVAADTVLLSAQAGPGGGETTLYRRPLDDADAPFTPCAGGLPDGLPGSINTNLVATWDEQAAVVLPSGDLYTSRDAGYAWRRLIGSLGDATAVVIL